MKYAYEPRKNNVPMRLSFVDIKKAYVNAQTRRSVSIDFPKELGLPSNLVARHVRCVYGSRDAGTLWEDVCRLRLESTG